MVTVSITKKDGTKYWNEYFPTMKAATEWVESEKTRFYWKADYKVEMIDTSQDEAIETEKLQRSRQAMSDARTKLMNELRELRDSKFDSVKDLGSALRKLIELVDLGG